MIGAARTLVAEFRKNATLPLYGVAESRPTGSPVDDVIGIHYDQRHPESRAESVGAIGRPLWEPRHRDGNLRRH